ncbi:MAG: Cna B-type domain-containing protein [Oscillospiraceae bacterium]|nr:Cna B-type domain-containing protein [Oscillospiraceae bacterium]
MKIYKTLRKRGLALFLALTMCLSLIQTTALADGLTSPADEGTICGIPAHTHTGECCAPGSELACGLEEAECHTHDEACFAVSEKLACTLEETGTAGGHTHDSACWGPLTELVCGIPEGEDHVHDGSCYQPVTELICGLEEDESHTHEDACCAPVEGLICGQEEAEAVEGHTHSAECYVTESVQICELEQTEGHVHGEDCYNTVLACGLDEHEHDAEDCYPVPADVQDFLELAERLPAPEDINADNCEKVMTLVYVELADAWEALKDEHMGRADVQAANEQMEAVAAVLSDTSFYSDERPVYYVDHVNGTDWSHRPLQDVIDEAGSNPCTIVVKEAIYVKTSGPNGGQIKIAAGQDIIIKAEGSGSINRETNPSGGRNSGYLFNVEGMLRLENISVSGSKNDDGDKVTKNALVLVQGENASLTLGSGAVLKDNANCAIDNGQGGAVYISQGSLTMESGSRIEGCTASHGGGVHVGGSARFTADRGASITGCLSAQGPSVYLAEGADFNNDAGIDGVYPLENPTPARPEDRIYVTVLVDGSNGYPSEPSIVKDRVFLSLKDENTLKRLDNNEPWLNNDYTQYIDKAIWDDPDFKESLYDEGTYGLFDVTGSKIKAHFKSEFDWDNFLGVIGKFDQEGVPWVIATDGKKPRENPNGDNQVELAGYEVVPYVIKFQPEGADCPGWHIDCRVVPKSWVSLSYDHNLPSGTTVENLTMPDSKDGKPGFDQTIQKAVWNWKEVEADGTITASYGTRPVTLRFLGWNTAADGSGEKYAPDVRITVNKDTVLYAQWEVEKPEYKVEFYYQNSVGSERYTCKDTEIRKPSMNDFASGTVKIADSDKTPSNSVEVPDGADGYEFDANKSTVETAIIDETAEGYPAVLKVYFKLKEAPKKPAFTVYKSVSPTTDVKAGTELTYTIVVKNTGNVALEQFTLTDIMTARKTTGERTVDDTPASIRTLDSGKSSDGVQLDGNVITIPALKRGAEATIVYKYTVGAKDEGKTLVNTITKPENLDESSGTENKLTTETAAAVTRITISGEKTWKDNGNAAGKRPESITVKLMNGNIEADSKTVSAGDDGKWSYSFEANKFDAEGREITYTIAEGPVSGYTPTVDRYNITNTIQSVGYTVEFYKDSTDAANNLGKEETGTAPYGSIIAEFATDKMIQDHAPGAGYGTGAVVSEDRQKTIGLTASENVIRVLYLAEKQPVPDTLSYTVDYREQGTNKKLADTKTVSTDLTLGKEVRETAIPISGYTPVAPIETVITIQAEGNAITFYYTANAAPDAGVHTLTIHYVYENGTAAAPDHVEKNLAEGITYDVPSPARDGYIADFVRVTGRMKNEDAEHTVIYRADRIGGGNDGKKPDGIPDSFEAVVYYSVNNTRYGTVAASYQTFNLGPDKSDARTLRNTASATALSRVYFIDWTLEGNRLDVNTGLNRSLTVESGEVYYVVANFGRRSTSGGNEGGTGGSSGGGNSGGSNGGTTVIPDTQTPLDPGITIADQDVPLAGAVGLNDADHFAYVIGYEEDGTVRPLNNISRAEVATIFFRLMTEEFRQSNWSTVNSFIDVEEGDWYNNAVSTCAKAGILTGYADGSFKPDASITRAEFAAVAARFLDDSYVDDGKGDFSDTADHWAASYIRLAAKAGWINGSGNRFDPEEYITRAQVMTIVNRMLDRTPDKDHMLPSMKTWTDNPEGTWYYEAVQEATNEHDYTRDEMSIETWTLVKQHRDWAAIELGWAANNGASAPQTKPETETQSLPDGI